MPKASTASQQFVAVKDIKDNVVILKNGQMCSIILASSINFALKSEDERQAILQQFQTFLNTLDFSLQIYIQSRRLNIGPYLELLSTRENQQDNDLMRIQLREYMDFVRTFTEQVEVMTKSFFVVVPYSPVPGNLAGGLTSVFGSGKKANSSELRFEENRLQLEQRVALVEQGLSRVGVRSIVLQQDDLVELFYHIYNPADPTGSAPTNT